MCARALGGKYKKGPKSSLPGNPSPAGGRTRPLTIDMCPTTAQQNLFRRIRENAWDSALTHRHSRKHCGALSPFKFREFVDLGIVALQDLHACCILLSQCRCHRSTARRGVVHQCFDCSHRCKRRTNVEIGEEETMDDKAKNLVNVVLYHAAVLRIVARTIRQA